MRDFADNELKTGFAKAISPTVSKELTFVLALSNVKICSIIEYSHWPVKI